MSEGRERQDPSFRRGDYWAFIRRRAWLIALALTVLGTSIVGPLLKPFSRVLIVAPITYVIILFTLWLSTRYGEALLATGGKGPRDPSAMESMRKNGDDHVPKIVRARHQRRSAFLTGAIALGCISMASALLWASGGRADARPDPLMWLLLLAMLLYTIRLVIVFGPSRVLVRSRERWKARTPSTTDSISSLSWIAVANVIIIATCGIGLVLVSGQGWRLAPFAVLSVATGVVLWLRLGQVIKSLP